MLKSALNSYSLSALILGIIIIIKHKLKNKKDIKAF